MPTNPDNPKKRRYSLTLQQRSAIDLLLAGLNDRQVADKIGVARSSVTHWRLNDSQFHVEIERRRAELWPGSTDSMLSLLPTALDALREQLVIGSARGRLALDLVSRAGLMGKLYSGQLATAYAKPATMEDLIDREVLRHRAATRTGPPPDEDSDTAAPPAPDPITEEERDAAYERLLARRDAPVPDDDAPSPLSGNGAAASTNGHATSTRPAGAPSATTKSMSAFS